MKTFTVRLQVLFYCSYFTKFLLALLLWHFYLLNIKFLKTCSRIFGRKTKIFFITKSFTKDMMTRFHENIPMSTLLCNSLTIVGSLKVSGWHQSTRLFLRTHYLGGFHFVCDKYLFIAYNILIWNARVCSTTLLGISFKKKYCFY